MKATIFLIDLFHQRFGVMGDNEKYLFEKLKKGDEVAFKVIFNKYAPMLYYFVYEYIPNDHIVENVVQDTLMTLWNKKFTLVDDTNLSAYLYTVAKNNCLYKLRDFKYSKKLYHPSDLGDMELKANMDALSSLDTSSLTFAEIEKIINDTMDQLPPQCRLIFQMNRFEDKKYKEIAEELNISVKAVEGQISKALKLFRINLKDYLPMMAFLFIR